MSIKHDQTVTHLWLLCACFWSMKYAKAALKYLIQPVVTDSSDPRLQQHVINKMSTLSSHQIHFSSFLTRATFTNNLIHSEKRKDKSNGTFHSSGAHTVLPRWMDFTSHLKKSLSFPQPSSKNQALIYLRLYIIRRIFLLQPARNGRRVATGDNGRRRMARRR